MDARILRVTPDLYPYSRGGIAIHTYLMSKYQARAGHSVTVLTVKDSNGGLDRDSDFEVIRFSGFRDPLGNPVAPGIVRYLRENLEEFDIVHVHSHLFISSVLALWARHADEVPAILTCHGVRSQSIPFFLSDVYLRTVTHAMLARTQGVLCYSGEDAHLLAKLTHTSLSQMHVVPNGVPLELFRPSRPASSKEPVIIWAGRMVRQKGVDLVLRAMKSVVEKVPSSRLVLLGAGPELRRVKTEIERMELERHVELLGNQPFEKMPRLYDDAAVCVISSATEGMPRTLMEATASGVPVIATRLPQLLPFSGKGVLLFEPGSVFELVDCVTRILSDPEVASRLSVESRRLAENEFDWDRTVSMTTEFCRKFAANASRAG